MKISFVAAFMMLGFTALVSQSLILREALISFQGNELTLGIVLANWIILTALGSRLFAKYSLKIKNPALVYVLFQVLTSLYIPASIFLIRILNNLAGLSPGEGMGIFPVFASTFFILAPLNFIFGAMFPLACRLWSKLFQKREESAGVIFILEALGFVIGGLIFTFLFINRLNSFQIAYILGMLNLVVAVIILNLQPPAFFKKLLYVFVAFLILAGFIGGASRLKRMQSASIDRQWQKCNVLKYKNTVYGNLTLVKRLGQYTIFSDGIPIITVPHPDTERAEGLVHFTMLGLRETEDVLVLGGGLGGVIGEILKYPVSGIDYLELDPGLIEMARSIPYELIHRELGDKRVRIKNIDAIRFLNKTKNKYDVIILNLPLAPSLQINRFYSREFISLVNKHLKDGGIFVCSTEGSLTYISNELHNLNGMVLNSLRNKFACVSVIPGETNLYLSSNNYLNLSPESILKEIKEKNIPTLTLNPAYVSYRLSRRNLDWFNSSIKGKRDKEDNSNLAPRGIIYSLSYWASLFSPQYRGLFRMLAKISFETAATLLCLLGLIWFLLEAKIKRLKKLSLNIAIFGTGFFGMSLNLIFILAYQSFCGLVFHHIALLATAFMAGLGLGAWLIIASLNKINKELRFLTRLETAMAGFSLLLWPLFLFLNSRQDYSWSWLIFIFSFFAGLLAGSEFPLVNKICLKKYSFSAAGNLYAADLIGACLGALITPIVLIPMVGVLETLILLVIIKLFSMVYVISSA